MFNAGPTPRIFISRGPRLCEVRATLEGEQRHEETRQLIGVEHARCNHATTTFQLPLPASWFGMPGQTNPAAKVFPAVARLSLLHGIWAA